MSLMKDFTMYLITGLSLLGMINSCNSADFDSAVDDCVPSYVYNSLDNQFQKKAVDEYIKSLPEIKINSVYENLSLDTYARSFDSYTNSSMDKAFSSINVMNEDISHDLSSWKIPSTYDDHFIKYFPETEDIIISASVPVDTYGGSVDCYTNSWGEKVQSPTYYSSKPAGATARCVDGTYSFSRSRRGTCSHHGGVAEWY